jgi:hypothetical protein
MLKLFKGSWLIAGVVLAHSWYPRECCGDDNECYPVPCGELVETGAGIVWRGYVFRGKQIRPTPDGSCHVCAVENFLGVQGWCVFVPAPSSEGGDVRKIVAAADALAG